MKKLVIPVLAVGLMLNASMTQAQLSKGHLLAGGGLGFSSTTPADRDPNVETKNSAFGFSPRVGYFVADNLAVGLDVQFNSSREARRTTFADTVGIPNVERTTTRSSLLIGPFVRYYMPMGAKMAFFWHLGTGFGSEKTTIKYSGSGAPPNPDDVKYGLVDISLRPGFTYFPTKRLGLEIMTDAIQLAYTRRSLSNLPSGARKEDYTDSSFSARADLRSLLTLGAVQIGASFYFGGTGE